MVDHHFEWKRNDLDWVATTMEDSKKVMMEEVSMVEEMDQSYATIVTKLETYQVIIQTLICHTTITIMLDLIAKWEA
jgi:hypothetical protein